MNFKQFLLDLDLVEDNNYLTLYCDLIENNKDNKAQLYKTQRHHIIPRCYYKTAGLPLDNSPDNIVNLDFKNHVLAHLLLFKCSKEKWFKDYNGLMVFLNYKKFGLNIDEYLSLDELQSNYECSCKLIGESKKGKCYVHNSKYLLMIDPKDLDYYLSHGYKKGNNKLKNKVAVTNGEETIIVNKEDAQNFLNKGYVKGHNHRTSQKIAGYRTIHKGDVQTMVPPEDLPMWFEKGYSLGVSENSKAKEGHPAWNKGTKGLSSSATKDMSWVTNGVEQKRLWNSDLEKFLRENPDYRKGKLSFCWVHKDGISKQVPKENLNEFLSNGYKQGMVKRNGTTRL